MRNNQGQNILKVSNRFLFGVVLLILSSAAKFSQTPFKTGVLPKNWVSAGTNCAKIPEFQIHKYNEDLYILRQSGCSNFEKPFLYLIFGSDKAMLLDTGAGTTGVGRAVRGIIDKWLLNRRLKSIQLIVAHSHAHGDHTSGDSQFRNQPNIVLIEPDLQSVQSFFGIKRWADEIVAYDLGKRIIDVIPIPGHEASSIAVYDRQTALLFTGDTLYPGRLYISEPDQYVRSVKRLVDFTQNKTVAHILGAHIENKRAPYSDYRVGTTNQPDEHALELGRGHLLELNEALISMRSSLVKKIMRDFTISP